MSIRRARQVQSPAAVTQPSRDAIAARAYARYLAGGRKDGHDLEDWLEAERELLAETASGSSSEPEDTYMDIVRSAGAV